MVVSHLSIDINLQRVSSNFYSLFPRDRFTRTAQFNVGSVWQQEETWTTNSMKYDHLIYEDWNFNSGNYLFTTDTK